MTSLFYYIFKTLSFIILRILNAELMTFSFLQVQFILSSRLKSLFFSSLVSHDEDSAHAWDAFLTLKEKWALRSYSHMLAQVDYKLH